MRNRPFNSLVSILSLQHPETPAPGGAQLKVIERLRDHHPDIAWQLMIALLPSPRAMHDPVQKPEFRDWKPKEPSS
jgi:hypothetical protein